MNKLLIAKSIVFLLAGILAAGLFLLLYKITNKHKKINPSKTIETSLKKTESFLSLTPGETAHNAFSCQDYLCIQILKNNLLHRIEIISPINGEKIHTLFIDTPTPVE